MKLLVASNNAHKIAEIRQILAPHFDSILSLRDVGLNIDVVEDGETFEQNALKKANEVLAAAGGIADAVLSDDSGLMVDALGGAPGVYSARFAGRGHNDADNNAKLLTLMQNVPDGERTCRFVCAAVLARRSMPALIARGAVEGLLLREGHGDSGFGYDPLFYYELYGKSFAELPAELKNDVSHRRRALNELYELLEGEHQ